MSPIVLEETPRERRPTLEVPCFHWRMEGVALEGIVTPVDLGVQWGTLFSDKPIYIRLYNYI